MIILKYIIVILISLSGACAAVCFNERYPDSSMESIPQLLKKSYKKLIVFSVCYTGFAIAGMVLKPERLSFVQIVEYILIWDTLMLIGFIDYKMKKIPNKLVIFVAVTRIMFLILEAVFHTNGVLNLLIQSGAGLAFGGLFTLICMLVSHGIGAGDIKLFAVLGLSFGLRGIISIMMYSVFLSFIICIVLLISRKAKMKSTLPMAPFIFIGLSLYLILI